MLSVFGGTGFIGGRYCTLYGDGIELVPYDDRHFTGKDVLYFISTTSNYNVFTDPTIDIKTNLVVLTEVLDNIRKLNGVFNFISSWFVYGESKLPVNELDYCEPRGFYSITKRCAEQLVISYCQTYSIPYRIIRLGSVYGRGDLGASRKKNVIQFLIHRLKNNEPIELYEDGYFSRDYIHVDDVCRAINLILKKAPINDTINVGCGVPIQFRDIIVEAKKYLGSTSEILTMNVPDYHELINVKDMCLDTSRLSSLGFSPRVSILDGIREMCDEQ